MRHKKIKIDRLDGAVPMAGVNSGYSSGSSSYGNGGTSAPAGSGSSSGSSYGSSSGSSSATSGGASAGGGSSRGGTSAGAGADVVISTNDNGGITNGQTTAPAYTTTNNGSNRPDVGTQEEMLVTIPTGETVVMGDLVIAIQEYYNRDKVSEKDISRAMADPAFLDFLQQKIKNAKKNKVSLKAKAELATASKVKTEEESGQDSPQGNSDSWTWLGVTMKKAWWIFMGASVALLVLVLVIVAIKTRKQ